MAVAFANARAYSTPLEALTPAQREAYDLIQAGLPATKEALAEKLGISESGAQKRLVPLKQLGLVQGINGHTVTSSTEPIDVVREHVASAAGRAAELREAADALEASVVPYQAMLDAYDRATVVPESVMEPVS